MKKAIDTSIPMTWSPPLSLQATRRGGGGNGDVLYRYDDVQESKILAQISVSQLIIFLRTKGAR